MAETENVPQQNKNEDEKKEENDGNKQIECVDFSGTWILEGSPDVNAVIDYYKSEGWGYMMRNAAPKLNITQIIIQNGNKMNVEIVVSVPVVGQVANEKTDSVIGDGKYIEYKDKDGPCKALDKWNDNKTEIFSDIVRVDDEKRTYK
eukprot:843739_1